LILLNYFLILFLFFEFSINKCSLKKVSCPRWCEFVARTVLAIISYLQCGTSCKLAPAKGIFFRNWLHAEFFFKFKNLFSFKKNLNFENKKSFLKFFHFISFFFCTNEWEYIAVSFF